jgi:hypothetical protein
MFNIGSIKGTEFESLYGPGTLPVVVPSIFTSFSGCTNASIYLSSFEDLCMAIQVRVCCIKSICCTYSLTSIKIYYVLCRIKTSLCYTYVLNPYTYPYIYPSSDASSKDHRGQSQHTHWPRWGTAGRFGGAGG